MSNQYLSFDVTKQSSPQQLITGRQGDSQLKFVSVLLWDGEKNIPYDLTGKQIAFEALKPDGTHIVDYNGIIILDAPHGLFRYSFNEQVFSVAGTMQQAFFKITHTDSDNNVIADSTLEVSINILENRVEFGINSKDYLSEYDDLITQVKKKFDDYAATVQDSIDKAQALHDQIVEYTNLINSKGVILRSEFGDISSIKQPLGQTVVDKLNNEFNDRGVNVKWFGAVGDGVADDGAAIKAAHDYANANNLNVIYPTDGVFYISEINNIEIKTNVDFANSKILINETPETVDTLTPVFLVTGDEVATHENDTVTTAITGKINANKSEPLTELANGQIQYVEIYDDNDLIFDRKGYEPGPSAKRDIFKIDGQGNVLSDITHDYSNITKIVTKSINSKIIIKNARFFGTNGIADGPGKYVWRNLVVERNNVVLNNIDYQADDFEGKKNSIGFIYTKNCSGIEIRDCDLQVMKSSGSYSIANYMTLDVTLDNVTAASMDQDSWGAHVSYYAKNLVIKNCKLNRIDSHEPIHNLTVLNSEIGDKGITTNGFGDLVIKDCRFNSDALVTLREDFGGFWNGNILIDNVQHYPATNYPKIINANPSIDYDFGIKTYLGNKYIRISNYTLHNNENTIAPVAIKINGTYDANIKPARDWYYLAQEITLNNLKCTGDLGVLPIYTELYRYLRSDYKSIYRETDDSVTLIPNTVLNIDNVRLVESSDFMNVSSANISNIIRPLGSEYSYNSAKDYSANHIALKVNIKHCSPLYASFRGLRVLLNAEDCLINTFMNSEGGGSQLLATLNNCIIEPRYSSSDAAKYMIRTESKRTTFINCRFRLPKNQDGTISVDDTDFVKVYAILAGMTHATNINLSAQLVNCKFESGFNFTKINSGWQDFGADLTGVVNDTIYRKIGTTAQAPYGAKAGQIYYNKDLNKLTVYDGISWI